MQIIAPDVPKTPEEIAVLANKQTQLKRKKRWEKSRTNHFKLRKITERKFKKEKKKSGKKLFKESFEKL